MTETRHVAVLGAGIVGVTCALALREAGFAVSLIDPAEPGGEQAASYGNAGWISPASVVPMSMPGLWRKIPGMLMDPLGPLTVRFASLPRLLPWLLRFVAAGATVSRVEATARALRPLLAPGPALHEALARQAGVADLIVRNGLLYAYPDRGAFLAEALAWRLRRDNGVVWEEHDSEGLRAILPQLSPRYRFGAMVPAGAHCRDPGAYVAALARHAESQGVRMIRARALGFRLEGQLLAGVATDTGPVACDHAVISAGIWSGVLAQAAGDRIPLESERGYHVVMPQTAPLAMPVQPSDTKMGMTPSSAGLRGAGQVELCSVTAPPNWRRAEILVAHLRRSFPALPETETELRRWLGHRPSTPDGLPVIGRSSASGDIIQAFGHGHVGLASAPMTARLVASLLSGRSAETPLEPYAPQRFRWALSGSGASTTR